DHRGLDRGQRAGDIIHMDTYPVRYIDKDGLNRVEHAVTMKDAFSKEAWFARVPTKDQVSSVVINQLNMIEQSGNKVRRLCMDGGSEFINQTLERYLLGRGIQPRVSPPNTQALNGIAESSVRTLKNDARTLLQHAARAPARLWHYATEHAVWIWNRTRVSSATKVTPYEASAKRPPSLPMKLVGVWGCDCFVHQRKEQRTGRGAMAAKSEPAIYLGHSARHNCANVLVLRTRKVVQSRDVRFFNDSFSFMKAYKQGSEAMLAAADGALESDDESDCSDDSDEVMPAQGGLEQPSAAEQKDDSGGPPDSADEEAEEEYVVQEILDSRVRGGVAQYKVLWEGYDKPTWEPWSTVADCEALDRYEAEQEAKPELRRSARNKPAVSGSESDDTELAFDDEDSGGAKMAMVMKALARLAPTDEWVEEETLLKAFVAAAKESGSISDRTPKTLEEAMSGPDAEKWDAARKDEHGNMDKMKVWNIVDRASLPPGTNVLPVK
ncbi:MAG: DDE-type integrase/transposase/recombinase, partial [Terracidiphilus sp.]|nr:DDE-type integrase/transposase/recombinase [Terracidiphilus sp.]